MNQSTASHAHKSPDNPDAKSGFRRIMDLAQAVQANYLPESSRMSKASFQTSPLTEVICGITFDAPDFASVHFGLYWQSIQARYPSLPKDTQPIGRFHYSPFPPNSAAFGLNRLIKPKLYNFRRTNFYTTGAKLTSRLSTHIFRMFIKDSPPNGSILRLGGVSFGKRSKPPQRFQDSTQSGRRSMN